MTDRKKVINAYECCKNPFDRNCEKCPYEKDCCHDRIPMFVIKKMIALLKEQEAVKPYQDYNGHDVWRCGKCGATICNIYHTEADEDSKNYSKFCIHCGSAIEWEST